MSEELLKQVIASIMIWFFYFQSKKSFKNAEETRETKYLVLGLLSILGSMVFIVFWLSLVMI